MRDEGRGKRVLGLIVIERKGSDPMADVFSPGSYDSHST